MDLTQLPVEDGFRMRGQQVTRLETFVDAAFAFASIVFGLLLLATPVAWLNNFTVGLPMWMYSVMGLLLWAYRARRVRVAPKGGPA